MFSEEEKRSQNFLTGHPFLAGVVAGLVTGLAVGFLFAPRSGKELRKQISGSVSDQTKGARHQWDKTKEQARGTLDTIKTSTGLAADKAEDEFTSYVSKAVKEANEAVEETDKAVRETDRLTSKTKSEIDKLRNDYRNS